MMVENTIATGTAEQAHSNITDKEIIDRFFGKGTPAAETVNAIFNWENASREVLIQRNDRLHQVELEQQQNSVSGYDSRMELNVEEKKVAAVLPFLMARAYDNVPDLRVAIIRRPDPTKLIYWQDFDLQSGKITNYLTSLRAAGQFLDSKGGQT